MRRHDIRALYFSSEQLNGLESLKQPDIRCKNPKCRVLLKPGRRTRRVAMNYCTDECYDLHLEDIRSSAKDRVAAYLAKKQGE